MTEAKKVTHNAELVFVRDKPQSLTVLANLTQGDQDGVEPVMCAPCGSPLRCLALAVQHCCLLSTSFEQRCLLVVVSW